jgi:hypothetical protein
MTRNLGLWSVTASLVVLGLGGAGELRAEQRVIDLRGQADAKAPLANPHKGWYHHFPDNHPDKYVVRKDDDLTRFPGMDHMYIRLAWSYLEPAEGRFDWEVIDGPIRRWTGLGLGVAFRISCKETSTDRIEQQFATPKWVRDAGAKGGHWRMGKETGPDGPWEPNYGDPVFLAKLDAFLAAFAARYDGKPWLRYIDLGSIGDWGEGHAWAGSRAEVGIEVRRAHLALYRKHFTKSQLIVSDDFVYALKDQAEREALRAEINEAGLGYRDDSILVDGYLAGTSATWTVRSPQFFEDVYRTRPNMLELEHYGTVKRLGNWVAVPGSKLDRFGAGQSGADYLRKALELLHATYIGYHGLAHEWLADNPELTVDLLNRCGYWYFLNEVRVPDALKTGQTAEVGLVWENRGVAPAYQDFRLVVRLEDASGKVAVERELDAGNRTWMPGGPIEARYRVEVPTRVKTGGHTLKVKLVSPAAGRDVLVALKAELRDDAGFYRVGTIDVVP